MNDISITTLDKMKVAHEKIVVITAYDAGFAQLVEQAGVDVILVGDSLGMVVQGRDTTLPVTVADMIYHTAMVTRVSTHALVVADMPFMSHATPERALEAAGRLMKQGGAHMIKIEGGEAQVETVRHLTQRAVPVCAHLGLLPQSIHQMGGYRLQASGKGEATQLLEDARAMQQAGAQMLVVEAIPELLAKEVTAALDIPVIGIGAGAGTDGQVLVLHDVIGITAGHTPAFAHNFMQGAASVQAALAAYVTAVRTGDFPTVGNH